MSERDYFHLHEAFGLVDAIKAISGCRSIMALDALKGVIDQRVAELERAVRLVEQKGVKAEQNATKVERKRGKPERKGGSDQKSMRPEHLDVVLQKVKEPFTYKDVATILLKHYKTVLKRDLSAMSADQYAYLYIKYMLSERIIEQDGKRIGGKGRSQLLFRRIKKKVHLEGVKDGIYVDCDDNRGKIKDALSVERDLCGTGDHDLDVDTNG